MTTHGFQQQGSSFVNPNPLKTAATPQTVGKKLKDEPDTTTRPAPTPPEQKRSFK